jgi:hypothetical protein
VTAEPSPNYTTAQSQLALMEQVINENVGTSQNLDEGIDQRFQTVGAMDEKESKTGPETPRRDILLVKQRLREAEQIAKEREP